MSVDARAVLREALSLSDDERADIAAELLVSLEDTAADEPALVREAWRRETSRRAERVLDGEIQGDDWHDLRQRPANELTGG